MVIMAIVLQFLFILVLSLLILIIKINKTKLFKSLLGFLPLVALEKENLLNEEFNSLSNFNTMVLTKISDSNKFSFLLGDLEQLNLPITMKLLLQTT